MLNINMNKNYDLYKSKISFWSLILQLCFWTEKVVIDHIMQNASFLVSWYVRWQSWWFDRRFCSRKIAKFTETLLLPHLYYFLHGLADVHYRLKCMSRSDYIKIQGDRAGTLRLVVIDLPTLSIFYLIE